MIPARKGDGTGLSFPGYSEVRKGDGTVLWSAAPAIPDGVVDNFESSLYEDVGNTLSDYYFGDTDAYVRWTNTVNEGSYSINADQVDSGSNFLNHTIYSTSGLPNYPVQGNSISMDNYIINSQGPDNFSLYFGVQDSDNYYSVYIRGYSNGNTFAIIEVNSGESTTIASSGCSIPTSTWNRLIVDWKQDGTISARIEDTSGNIIQSEISGSSNLYTSGGIGYRIAVKERTKIVLDNVRVSPV